MTDLLLELTDFNLKFMTVLPLATFCKAWLCEWLTCYINKPRQQHVASPSTPVCPSRGQNKMRTALFSWKEGHGVSLPGHSLLRCDLLSKARKFQDLREGFSGEQ